MLWAAAGWLFVKQLGVSGWGRGFHSVLSDAKRSMIKMFRYRLTLACGLCVASLGCSSSSVNENAAISSTVNANASQNVMVNVPNVDWNANAANGSNANGSETRAVTDPTMGNGKRVSPTNTTAPEDSEYRSELTDVAREIRTFKNHPQLLKVEKIIEPKKQTVKVYLKDGRVLPADPDKIKSIRYDAAVTFLEAAGLGPKKMPAPAVNPEKEAAKEEAMKGRP